MHDQGLKARHGDHGRTEVTSTVRLTATGARAGAGSARIHRVDCARAQAVAAVFLEARRASTSAIVHAAYADLGAQAHRWFTRLTGWSAVTPIRVVHTRCQEPYATGQELAERVRAERVLELWPAHYDRDRAHPLLDTSIGGTYDCFRAVHDIVSHAALGYGFDRDGEFSAWLAEDRLYDGLARWALATELHAQHSVLWTTGVVAEHKGTLLPPWLLRGGVRCVLGHNRRDNS